MVKFGEKLAAERWAGWASAYLDYDLLKRKLDAIVELDEPSAQPIVNVERIREARKNIFQGYLDEELQKVLSFYRSKLLELSKHVADAKKDVDSASRTNSEVLQGTASDAATKDAYAMLASRIQTLKNATEEITQLLGFVSLNMAAVRKILKKYAKHVEPAKPMPGFLTLQIEHPHEKGWNMLQGTFLPARMADDLENFQHHRELVKLKEDVHRMFESLRESLLRLRQPQRRNSLSTAGTAGPAGTPGSTSPSHGSAARAEAMLGSAGSAVTPRRSLSLRRQFSGLSGQIGIDLEHALEEMDSMEALAQRNAGLVHARAWSEVQAGIFTPAPPDELATATTSGLLLNCINSGLYMANYNLIIPTITELCHHIGVSNAAVGLIIGCCDVATIPGTTGYSLWTNRSYKWPLVTSAVACLLGNLAYCLSYDARLLWLLVVARLVTGLGSARTVNRRYIAMFVKKADRTWASALFVSLSAVGMALGPLLALPLSRFPDLQVADFSVNHITMGGWAMSAAWVVFIIVTLCVFDDPLKRQALAPDPLQQPLLANDADTAADPIPEQDLEGSIPGDGAAGGAGAPPKANGLKASRGQLAGNGRDLEEIQEYVEDTGTATFREKWESFWESSVPATLICIFLCFVLKVAQQAYIDGLPIFTEGLYGWTNAMCGVMLGVLGLTAPLVNTSIGALSARLSDRRITVGSILITGAGCVLLMKGGYPPWMFFVGGVGVYMGTIVLEAVSMSLTSKVIDERMSKGLFNAGLLSTQAGTIGRLSGNLMLSAVAALTGAMTTSEIAALARTLFGLNAAFMAFSLAGVVMLYRRLAC